MVHKDIYLTAARGGDRPHMPERNARTVTQESAFPFWFQLAVPSVLLSFRSHINHSYAIPILAPSLVLRCIHTDRYPQKGATRCGLQSHIELITISIPFPHTSCHDPCVITNEHFAITERICRHKKKTRIVAELDVKRTSLADALMGPCQLYCNSTRTSKHPLTSFL